MLSCISFNINGTPYTANSTDIPVDTSLNTYIRNHAQLSGTKLMCNEGGCGVCIVSVTRVHPCTNKSDTIAVNSCLMPLFSCHNVDITTVEGIGNKKDGFCPEQTRLWRKAGSQCGFCSPGMIMNMHSLLESQAKTATMEKIEKSFGGNICRCTGYRPILDAFKSLAVDADNSLLCHDIEDLPKMCTGSSCDDAKHTILKESLNLKFRDGGKWFKVYSITEILQILAQTTEPYMLIAGNTAHGVYRRPENLKLFVDIIDVPDLRNHSIADNELVLGANITLAEVETIFESVSNISGFEYCLQLAKHVDLMANVAVRNAVGAKLTIIDANDNRKTTVDLAQYLRIDMKRKVIVNVKLRTLTKTFFKFKTYKIMVRAQNSHAYVNAAFLLKFSAQTVESASICFGGIHPKFIHASDTETFLRGKKLYSNETLQLAIKVLKNEMKPDQMIGDASTDYRKRLAVSLFYKFVLSTCNENLVKPEHKSGANTLIRPLSRGTQTYETKEEKYPLTEALPKYGGMEQVSGAAKYSDDVPHMRDELWAAFVPATKVRSKIGRIDATEALKIPGVRYFFSALDIPGKNSFTPTSSSFISIVEDEEIFVGYRSGVLFYGQPVGIILAETHSLATLAATKVKISYLENDSYMSMARTLLNPLFGEKQIQPTVQDVFNSKGRLQQLPQATNSKLSDATKTITGRVDMGSQYHMHMETQACVCFLTEDGMSVHSSTQWTDCINVAISECLNIPANSIHIEVKRVGGGFGGKLSRSSQIACACACHLTGLPVRFVLSLESNMNVIGKRNAMVGDYTIDVDGNGKIVKLNANVTHDMGCSMNESPRLLADLSYANCYDSSSWHLEKVLLKTDAPSMTWCRAPGTSESIAMAEMMMEHIAKVTDKDPMAVRMANMAPDSISTMKPLIQDFVKDIDFSNRKNKIDEFNRRNRWNKKGIAVVPMKYPILYIYTNTVYVSVYHGDGTVIVSHGGIEIGQGMNTKITQVAAHILGISHSIVKVTPTNNVIGANCALTGGSATTELICFAVAKACEEINNRLKPLRNANKGAQWIDLAKAAYTSQISLSAMYTAKANDFKPYEVWALSCAEIEIDLLTGNILVHRVDIAEDVGQSMNPSIDVGQIEGAFVMGMGLWLTESLMYNRENGELLTNRTSFCYNNLSNHKSISN